MSNNFNNSKLLKGARRLWLVPRRSPEVSSNQVVAQRPGACHPARC